MRGFNPLAVKIFGVAVLCEVTLYSCYQMNQTCRLVAECGNMPPPRNVTLNNRRSMIGGDTYHLSSGEKNKTSVSVRSRVRARVNVSVVP